MPIGVYKHQPHSEERKQKISLSMKGKNTWMKGKKLSDETKEKISIANKSIKHSKEWNEKVGEANKGKKRSLETRKRISLALLKNPRRYWLGKKRPDMTGKKSPVWVFGNYKKQDKRNDSAYQNWVKKCKKRDKGICKINNKDCSGYCIVHHILSWRDYPELRYTINNGITLCQFHHPRKRVEEKRLIPIFQKLVEVIRT